MKRIHDTEKAVSPVIATILMVAMTVVLTAVLYIMVMGITGSNVDSSQWGSIELDQISPTEFDVTFGDFSPDARPIDLKILIQTGTDEGTYVFSSNLDGNLTFESGLDLCDIYYQDQADNAMISIGDYARVTGVTPGETYSVYVLDAVHGGQIVVQHIDM